MQDQPGRGKDDPDEHCFPSDSDVARGGSCSGVRQQQYDHRDRGGADEHQEKHIHGLRRRRQVVGISARRRVTSQSHERFGAYDPARTPAARAFGPCNASKDGTAAARAPRSTPAPDAAAYTPYSPPAPPRGRRDRHQSEACHGRQNPMDTDPRSPGDHRGDTCAHGHAHSAPPENSRPTLLPPVMNTNEFVVVDARVDPAANPATARHR